MKIQKEWNNKYNGLIEKVEGDEWHAGNLSYHLKSRPKWFYWDGKFVLPLFEDNYADMIFEENKIDDFCRKSTVWECRVISFYAFVGFQITKQCYIREIIAEMNAPDRSFILRHKTLHLSR